MMRPSVVSLLLLNTLLGAKSWASPIASSSATLPPTPVHNQQQDLNPFLNKPTANDENPFYLAPQQQQQISNQATPIEIGNASDSFSGNSNTYFGNQNSFKFLRVNVSNVCDRNHMKVTVRLSRPFYGLIHAREKRKKVPCFVEGNGDQSYSLDISFTLLPTDAAYCGMVAHQMGSTWLTRQLEQQQLPRQVVGPANQSIAIGPHGSQQQHQHQETLSVALVVRLHKTIEFSDDRYFLLSCPNRCSRSDCSSADSNNNNNKLEFAHERRGFVVSDSSLAPVFRSAGQADLLMGQFASLPGQQRKLGQLATIGDRCNDTMADLKFQWLVKLCWILIGLVALMFCTIFYLCIAAPDPSGSSTARKRGPSKDARDREKSQVPGKSSHRWQSSDQSSATYQSTKPSCADTSESVAATDLGWSPSMVDQQQQQQQHHHMDQVREDNRYLANKQHLLLTDFLAAKNAIEQQCEQQARPILGRSEDTFGVRQLGQVVRRRSIGPASAAFLDSCLQGSETLPASKFANPSQRSDQLGPSKLNPKHKLKSKSQTTIYYEQGQDPFAAVPFNVGAYLGANDYLSPPNGQRAPNEHYLDLAEQNRLGQPDGCTFMEVQQSDPSGAFNYNAQANTLWSNFEPQSLPVPMDGKYLANDLFAPNRPIDLQNKAQLQHHQWRTAPMNADETSSALVGHQQPQRNGLTTSQFDPQNHSRQLIDLIQHKHREQMALANRTEAGMEPCQILTNNPGLPSTKPMPRPILTGQQQRQTSRTEQQRR